MRFLVNLLNNDFFNLFLASIVFIYNKISLKAIPLRCVSSKIFNLILDLMFQRKVQITYGSFGPGARRVQGTYSSIDQGDRSFRSSMAPFGQETGATIHLQIQSPRVQ